MTNPDSKKIILAGFFPEIVELCEENGFVISGITDKLPPAEDSGCIYPYLGRDEDARSLYEKYRDSEIIIVPDNPYVKEKIEKQYSYAGFDFGSVISKKANISKSCRIGKGAVIQAFANVSANSVIGNFVKINTFGNITHDCFVDDYCVIAPNAVLLGNVSVGKRAYIGANATILPGISVAPDTVIGAGAVVTKNITEPGKTYAGVPASILKKT